MHHLGHQVRTIKDPRWALEWLGEHEPDLILLDLRMPEMMGQRVYQELQVHWIEWCS